MASLAGRLAADAKKLVNATGPMGKKFWYYAKVELTPPSPRDIPEIARGFTKLLTGFKQGTWKNLTVKQAWVNMLVATEVGCWFFIGECIGKKGLIGYDV